MASIVGGQAGQVIIADGVSSQAFRQGRYSESIVSELNPKYYEQAYRGNVFFAAHQAATTFSANGLTSATAVGLCIFNATNSQKNLVPFQVEILMTAYVTTSTDVQVVAVATSAVSTAAPTTGGALTVYQSFGPTTSKAVAIAAQTMTFSANPIIWKNLYSAFVTTTVAAAIPTASAAVIDLGGSLVIPPGAGMAVVATNASTGFVSLSWLELAQ